jgi:pyruvoyl-dependent arginine decarboxylase (PvlArgDC)
MGMGITADKPAVTTRPDPAEVLTQAISRYPDHHDGYRLTGGYIAAPFVVTAERPAVPDLTRALSAILGFDLAEVQAGIGPVNAWTVSSFCGPDEGLIAGIDLLPSGHLDDLYIFSVPRHDGEMIPVYAMHPTLNATAALLHRWQIRDGAFVPFAMKHVTAKGPAVLAAVLGIGVPADSSQARLFMEDSEADTPAVYYERLAAAGALPGDSSGHGTLPDRVSSSYKQARFKAAARSVAEIGAQRGRLFARIFVGAHFTIVPDGHVGCAMAAAAYLQIARSAVPAGGPAELLNMTLEQWLAGCAQ